MNPATIIWLIIVTAWVFIAFTGWWKFIEERKKHEGLSVNNMKLTMENYNLNVRLSKIIPFKEKRA
jgi:hypothetical protein